MGYREVYQGWKDDPEGFMMEMAEGIDWIEKPTGALDASNAPLYEWFTDGVANTCYNAVDRHVEAGNGDRVAIIYRGTQPVEVVSDVPDSDAAAYRIMQRDSGAIEERLPPGHLVT